MGNRVSGSLLAGLIITMLTLVAASGRTDSPERSVPSPRAFVPPQSCSGVAPCAPGYWVFRAPDCEYYDVRHSPGAVLRLESGTTLQCRCRLVWVLTRQGEPPDAKVTCKWVDLDEARLHD